MGNAERPVSIDDPFLPLSMGIRGSAGRFV